MATQSTAEEFDEREHLAKAGRDDVDFVMSDDRTVAIAIIALRRGGDLSQSVGVLSADGDAPDLVDFSNRINDAMRTQFPRLPA